MRAWFMEIWNKGMSFVRTVYNAYDAFLEVVRDLVRKGYATADVLDDLITAHRDFKRWAEARGFTG